MWKMRLTIVVLTGVIFVGLGIWGGILLSRLMPPPPVPHIQNTAALLRQVQTLAQLVTVKYVLEKVVILEDPKWYGENRVLLVAHGVVKAGLDLGKLRPGDLQLKGSNLLVRLPPAEIMDVYLDDKQSQVVERTTGLLRQFDKNLEQNARRQAVDDLRRSARYHGILQEADERARMQLAIFFERLGLAVEFRAPGSSLIH